MVCAVAGLALASPAFCQDALRDELRHPVNLILQQGTTGWIDPRGPLSQKSSELGLNVDDIVRIRVTIGYVVCPGNLSGGQSTGTAMVVGDGTVIVTDVHLFINPATNERREPLSDCVFVNQGTPRTVVKLDFSNEQTYKFYTYNSTTEWYNDRALVHLKERVTGTRPFPIGLVNDPIKPGDKIIMVSAEQQQIAFSVDKDHFKIPIMDGKAAAEFSLNREPVVQSCIARAYYPASSRASSILYTECNATERGSGSVMFTRENGVLTPRALLTQEGTPAADFKPYKTGKGVAPDELSFSLGVGLDPSINADIDQIEKATEKHPSGR
jgi:hypothetical protein